MQFQNALKLLTDVVSTLSQCRYEKILRVFCWSNTFMIFLSVTQQDNILCKHFPAFVTSIRMLWCYCHVSLTACTKKGKITLACFFQAGGWCASSPNASKTYQMYGPSTACREDGEGGPWANNVYRVRGVNSTGQTQTFS